MSLESYFRAAVILLWWVVMLYTTSPRFWAMRNTLMREFLTPPISEEDRRQRRSQDDDAGRTVSRWIRPPFVLLSAYVTYLAICHPIEPGPSAQSKPSGQGKGGSARENGRGNVTKEERR